MSLRFILGRAGTGKSRACLEEIRSQLKEQPDGPPLVMLVPEQATFQYEVALAATPGLGGIVRAQVLSFRRLAWRVLLEVGGAARIHIGDLGKRMVLQGLLEKRRSELQVFHRAAGQRGFADTLAGAISEMKLYRVRPEDLAKGGTVLAERGQQLLAGKLLDLALLYSDFELFLKGSYTDPDDYLNLLAERLDRSPTVRGAEIWVDGFTGFTPQEYWVMEKLLSAAGRVNVALCLDGQAPGGRPGETDVFYPTRETYDKLLELAVKTGTTVETSMFTGSFTDNGGQAPHRFFAAPAIAHLERWFFRRPGESYAGSPGEIRLVAGTCRRAEVEAAAREIIRLCRDRGCRWRDIAVTLRDLEPYYILITSVFSDHGIPFFIDRKRTVMHHPLVELVRSALEAVCGGWAYEPVFRYLKTDLAPVTRNEADLLENYVLAHGIRGTAWTDNRDWTYCRRDTLEEDREGVDPRAAGFMVRVNRARAGASRALLNFYRQVKENVDQPVKTVRDISAALIVLLEELGVPARLEEWRRRAEESGQLEEAAEHAQVWDKFIELLEQMVAALGDESLLLGNYARIMDAGLESIRLGLIPPGLDQVLVGSLDRSRNPNVRAIMVLGAGEGVLPARPSENGVFTDGERERLAGAGLELAPTGRRKVLEEQYLVYLALTRGSKFLYLSYPLADEEGRALAPSPVVARIKELLPGINGQVLGVEPEGIPGGSGDEEYITSPDRCLSYLGGRLREALAGAEPGPIWWDVYNWFVSEEYYREKTHRALSGLFHRNREKNISRAHTRALYGNVLNTSISRLEKFRACPFSHFLSYGIGLKERAVYKLGAPDLGRFFHAALKMFTDLLKQSGMDWGSLKKSDIINLVGRVVEDLTPRLQNEILLSSARHRHLLLKLKRQVTRAVLVLAEHARRGIFRPVGTEVYFGPGGEIPPLTIELPGGQRMEMSGRIDRVDLAVAEKGGFIRVIDYKSGVKGLKLSGIYNGLELQLLTYLDVALSYSREITGVTGRPGGVLYFTVADPMLKTTGPVEPEQVERLLMKELKMKGMVLADPDVVKMMDAGISGHSDLIGVALGKDGFYKNSPVLSEEQFELLVAYLRELQRRTGGEIIAGEVGIKPYRWGKTGACTYCRFKPVCQFDPLVEDNVYRILTDEPEEEIWKKILEILGSVVEQD